MQDKIFIEEDKEFSLDELAHLVSRAIRSVARVDIDKDEVVYSRDDVYFTIVDVLGYINERTPGRFKFDQCAFQQYIVHYVPDKVIKRQANKESIQGLARTALYLEELTGKPPLFAKKAAVAEAMAALKQERSRSNT